MGVGSQYDGGQSQSGGTYESQTSTLVITSSCCFSSDITALPMMNLIVIASGDVMTRVLCTCVGMCLDVHMCACEYV